MQFYNLPSPVCFSSTFGLSIRLIFKLSSNSKEGELVFRISDTVQVHYAYSARFGDTHLQLLRGHVPPVHNLDLPRNTRMEMLHGCKLCNKKLR